MKIVPTKLTGVCIIEPNVMGDVRGFLIETFQQERYSDIVDLPFVQDNFSRSGPRVLRGLHYQTRRPQGKLIWVVRGEIFDVAVDLRQSSPTFGQWTGVSLSDTNHHQVYIPPEFAHGFCVLSQGADVMYKCTDFYDPQNERTIAWNDPTLAIDWPIQAPVVSPKDQCGRPFAEADYF